MKTVFDILRAILIGPCPNTETGIIMEIISFNMVYDGRF